MNESTLKKEGQDGGPGLGGRGGGWVHSSYRCVRFREENWRISYNMLVL